MKKIPDTSIVLTTFMILFLSFSSNKLASQDQIIESLDVQTCDSLINANLSNPYFVILDVRRPTEYNPEHIMGAINRNYYDAEFQQQLDSLDKDKMYLIHCKSGGRSGASLAIMETLGFMEVYNMIGGINAWKNQDLIVSDSLFPLAMYMTDTLHPMKEIELGFMDTIRLKLTNRGNATLRMDSISELMNNEFTSSFFQDTILEGAQDYEFEVIYSPEDSEADTLEYTIYTNGGVLTTTIIRSGVDETSNVRDQDLSTIIVFPNPASSWININGLTSELNLIRIFDINGSCLLESNLPHGKNQLDLQSLSSGQYILSIHSGTDYITRKIIIE